VGLQWYLSFYRIHYCWRKLQRTARHVTPGTPRGGGRGEGARPPAVPRPGAVGGGDGVSWRLPNNEGILGALRGTSSAVTPERAPSPTAPEAVPPADPEREDSFSPRFALVAFGRQRFLLGCHWGWWRGPLHGRSPSATPGASSCTTASPLRPLPFAPVARAWGQRGVPGAAAGDAVRSLMWAAPLPRPRAPRAMGRSWGALAACLLLYFFNEAVFQSLQLLFYPESAVSFCERRCFPLH